MVKLTEKEIEDIFNKERDKIYKIFPKKKAMNNFQIDKYCKKYIKNFIGVFPQDTMPFDKIGYLIVNTDTKNKKGSHWISIYLTKNKIYIYDTYARKGQNLLKHIAKKSKNRKLKIINSDLSDKEQSYNSSYCGQSCIIWCLIASKLGINNAILI